MPLNLGSDAHAIAGSVFPVGLSQAIECKQVVMAPCANEEYAVWRDSGGILHANQNRCPHRGMRLQFGFVRDDRLNCLYHGWSYDEAGQCRLIPAHPIMTPPKTICLQTYEVEERYGVVWLATSGGRASIQSSLQRLTLPEGIETTPVRSAYVRAPMRRVISAMEQFGTGTHRELGPLTATVLDDDGRGLLYALQDTGPGRVGIHLNALWRGTAPVDARLQLSRALRQVEWKLNQEVTHGEDN